MTEADAPETDGPAEVPVGEGPADAEGAGGVQLADNPAASLAPTGAPEGLSREQQLVRFFETDGPLRDKIPGYVSRPFQVDMALLVDAAIDTPGARLVVEAGTGTGKSFAYLVPALSSGKKVLVTTGTKALQDQLYQKDVPILLDTLEALTGFRPKAAVVKGRQNYLCKLRFEEFKKRPLFVFHEDAAHFDTITTWAATTERGDRAELKALPEPYSTWNDIDAGGETCIGTACDHYETCYVTKMRRDAEGADLIIANHHLLCADARVRLEASSESGDASFAQVLPTVDALVVDEAHQLPDVATRYFGVAVSPMRLARLSTDAERIIGPSNKSAAADKATRAQGVLASLKSQGAALAELCEETLQFTRKVDQKKHIEPFKLLCGRAQGSLSELAALADAAADAQDEQSALKAEAKGVARRASQLIDELKFIADRALTDERFVVHIEESAQRMRLVASPVDVAAALSGTIMHGARPVVLTSATLCVGESSETFESRVGIVEGPIAPDPDADPNDDPIPEDAEMHVLRHTFESPFAFSERAALYVPKDFPAPNQDGYMQALHEELLHLVTLTGGGALLLFTSYRALTAAHEALAAPLQSHGLSVWRQGDAPTGELLQRMRETENGVLMATQSFWEGVDIRGAALRLLTIDKLPFKPPNDPLLEARAALCEARGQNPFMALSVPDAAISLKQGVGRLMRSEDDAGIVALFDVRIRQKRYGATLLRSLPPLLKLGRRDLVDQFWHRRVKPLLDAHADLEAQ